MFDRSLLEMIGMSLVMGFSIYLSFPIIMKRNMGARSTIFLVAFAVGILVFLAGDIFSDVASKVYASGSYIANIPMSLLFIFAVVALFALLFTIENLRRKSPTRDSFVPSRVALIVAIGMGLQNLTEGLVFGAAYVVGLIGLFLVILIGFIMQNFTEGFPIASPFFGKEKPKTAFLAGLYFIGGFPTIVGSLIGYYYINPYLNILFDGLAIGAIIYVIIPMLRNLFKQAEFSKAQSLVYAGILFGFVAGFAVNAI